MMSEIQVLDKKFIPYIEEKEILNAVANIAKIINDEYKDKNPLFIAILNGVFIFASDLLKQISIPCDISFVKLASYKGTSTTSNVVQAVGLEANLLNRHVIILDDILDTGTTLNSFLNDDLKARMPASIKIVVLLHKYEKTIYDFENKHVGIRVKDKFLIGYGLDYNGGGRNYKDIYELKS